MFDSQHLSGFIEILLPALIASDREAVRENRKGLVGACLYKGDSMAKKDILANMNPVILAENHPAIMDVVPHAIVPPFFATCDHQLFVLVR